MAVTALNYKYISIRSLVKKQQPGIIVFLFCKFNFQPSCWGTICAWQGTSRQEMDQRSPSPHPGKNSQMWQTTSYGNYKGGSDFGVAPQHVSPFHHFLFSMFSLEFISFFAVILSQLRIYEDKPSTGIEGNILKSSMKYLFCLPHGKTLHDCQLL